MEKRYAVAYINDGDEQITFLDNAISLFGQTKEEGDRVKQYLIAYTPEKETPHDTYQSLQDEIEKNTGETIEIVFTNGFPTIWRTRGLRTPTSP